MVDVGAAVVTDGAGRVLIACRKTDGAGLWAELTGLWEFPGGKREAGESDAACVTRELLEELALPITPVRTLCALDYPGGAKPVRLHFVLATADGAAPLTLHVHADARWVPVEALSTYRFCPADAAFIAQYDLRAILADTV